MTSAEAGAPRRLSASFERVRDGRWIEFTTPGDVSTCPSEKARSRVARLLAFAHSAEQRIDSGEVASRAAMAREIGITRARVTQILDLTLLAPDIQEEILFAEAEPGFQPINEHALRWVLRVLDWPTQRARWRDLNDV